MLTALALVKDVSKQPHKRTLIQLGMTDNILKPLKERISEKFRKYSGKVNQYGLQDSVIATITSYFEKNDLVIITRQELEALKKSNEL